MRRFTLLLGALLFTFLISSTGRAQQKVISVAPGYGSLNDSVAAEGPGIYMLKAGGWYGLNAVLNTATEGPTSIIGETPAPGQMPAMIQTGYTSSGKTFTQMFKSYNDFTLKNVFLVDADLNDGLGAGLLFIQGPGRVVFDSVTADPVGSHYFIESYVKSYTQANIYVTNSLLMNRTLSTTVGDGYFFANVIWDTLYFENNTVVHCGNQFIKGPNAENDTVSFNWINHNTFLFNKGNFKSDFGDSNTFITNNLFFMGGYYPERVNPGSPDPYVSNTIHGIILDDTLLYETVPSLRKHFIEYNSNYRAPGIWNLATYVNQDLGVDTYIPQFIPPLSLIDSSRETQMYNTKSAFPNFYCADNYSDTSAQNSSLDPQFTNSKIYNVMDSCVAFADSAANQQWGGVTANTALWPDIFYRVDTSFGYPTTWPRFDGAYKSSTFSTASIGGLPLGDLNWFPNQKKIWETYRDTLMSRILNEDQTQWVVTAVKNANGQVPTKFALSQNYPNPFNPTTEIDFSVAKAGVVSLKVYNVLGQEVATLVNNVQENPGMYRVSFNASKFASGVYFYRLQQGTNLMTKKMLLLK